MRYNVVRFSNGGTEEVASCRYIEDARAVLERWYAGYIAANGEIIESKRMP